MTRVLKGLGLALVLCALMPAAALADDYYASQGGSGSACTSSSTPCDLLTAIGQADGAPGSHTVHVVGPLTLTTVPSVIPLGAPGGPSVSLVGSGSGSDGTSISGAAVPLFIVAPGSSISHLAVRSSSVPIGLFPGSSMDDVVASTTSSASPAVVVVPVPGGGDATISHSTMTAPVTDTTPTVVSYGDASSRTTISDSTIKGGGGLLEQPLVPGGKGVHVVRSVLDVMNVGAQIVSPDAAITDSVIRISGPSGQAVSLSPGPGAAASHADLLQDTIVGPSDGTGSGVYIPAATSPTLPGSATVTGSIIRGFATDLDVVAGSATGSATATSSDLDQSTPGAGNLAVDPKFTNASGGDYSLLPGSPLIDAAGTDPANGETDLAGAPRVVDGNGDGVAARDIGAYEYQPPPPPAPPAPPVVPPKPRVATLKLVLPHGTLTLGSGRLVLFPVLCPKSGHFACRVTVTLQGIVKKSARSKTIKLGSGHALISSGKRAKVKIHLTRKAVALIKAHKLKRVTAIVSGKDAAGISAKLKRTYRIRYKAPRHHH